MNTKILQLISKAYARLLLCLVFQVHAHRHPPWVNLYVEVLIPRRLCQFRLSSGSNPTRHRQVTDANYTVHHMPCTTSEFEPLVTALQLLFRTCKVQLVTCAPEQQPCCWGLSKTVMWQHGCSGWICKAAQLFVGV